MKRVENNTDNDKGPTKSFSKKVKRESLMLFAGAASGAITKTSIAPLDRIKILHQIQGMRGDMATPKKYLGIFQTFGRIVKEEGFFSLYNGNGANILRVVPAYAFKFYFNDTFKDLVKRPNQKLEKLSFSQLMVAGSAAGCCQIMITYPLDVLRTRLALTVDQAGGAKFKGIGDCFLQTVQKEGLHSIYKGMGPTIISGTPYIALQMTFYEVFQKIFKQTAKNLKGNPPPVAKSMGGLSSSTDGDTNKLSQLTSVKNKNSDLSNNNNNNIHIIISNNNEPKFNFFSVDVLWKLLSGACAGLMAQTITYPGDTVRRRMQCNGIGGEHLFYQTSWDAIVKIYRQEGWTAFFKGVKANSVACIPGAAIQFLAYEYLKVLFGVS